jgi:hypothetical protein
MFTGIIFSIPYDDQNRVLPHYMMTKTVRVLPHYMMTKTVRVLPHYILSTVHHLSENQRKPVQFLDPVHTVQQVNYIVTLKAWSINYCSEFF